MEPAAPGGGARNALMRIVGAILLAGVLGMVAGLWTWTRPGDPDLIAPPDSLGTPVHILNNGFHTDIAVPRWALEAGGGPLAAASRSVGPGDWILIGWGDAKFFVDESPMEGRLPDGLRAFFRPGNPAVVMLDPETGDPSRRFDPAARRTLMLSPEAFAGIIAEVPFVDVLTTMLDDSLPLTPPEWPEWGNPILSEADYRNIASYSPYDNVTDQEYPPILAVAGLTDPRVTYWEPAKWAARLRARKRGDNPVLFKINMDSGHAGASGRFSRLEEIAFNYAFALKVVGKAQN